MLSAVLNYVFVQTKKHGLKQASFIIHGFKLSYFEIVKPWSLDSMAQQAVIL